VGCVPSKALLRAARAYADVRDAADFGVRVPPGTHVEFPAVMTRMRRLRAQISQNDSARRYRSLGVDVYLRAGRFTEPDAVEVEGETLRFAKAVIATGARAAAPEIPGLAEAGYLTNESVFTLTELPRRLAVIGAGPIGCELAQAFARVGSEVWLLERGDRVLPREDRDAALLVQRALEWDGVRLSLACRVERVEGVKARRCCTSSSEPSAARSWWTASSSGWAGPPMWKGSGWSARGSRGTRAPASPSMTGCGPAIGGSSPPATCARRTSSRTTRTSRPVSSSRTRCSSGAPGRAP
jgi:pyruvate/2-oxoglutarate dehydrogenase complex dihydrolipoamide dehydrogenase (E3) component